MHEPFAPMQSGCKEMRTCICLVIAVLCAVVLGAGTESADPLQVTLQRLYDSRPAYLQGTQVQDGASLVRRRCSGFLAW